MTHFGAISHNIAHQHTLSRTSTHRALARATPHYHALSHTFTHYDTVSPTIWRCIALHRRLSPSLTLSLYDPLFGAASHTIAQSHTLPHTITPHHTLSHTIAHHGVATMCRRLKIIGLFCRIQSLLQVTFAKETYNFKEPTNGWLWGGYDVQAP